jgi:hypothetical protein
VPGYTARALSRSCLLTVVLKRVRLMPQLCDPRCVRFDLLFARMLSKQEQGASTFRSGCTIIMRTSLHGMRRCVTRLPMNSA